LFPESEISLTQTTLQSTAITLQPTATTLQSPPSEVSIISSLLIEPSHKFANYQAGYLKIEKNEDK